MFTVSIVLFIVSIVLGIVSMRATSRSNAGGLIPWVRGPEISSGRATAFRAASAGVAVLGASFVSPTIGYWCTLCVVVVLAVPLAVQWRHNQRLMRGSADGSDAVEQG